MLIVGDSLAVNLETYLQPLLPCWVFVNHARGGSTPLDRTQFGINWQTWLPIDLVLTDPDLVFVEFTGNMPYASTPGEYEVAISAATRRLVALSAPRGVLVAIPPVVRFWCDLDGLTARGSMLLGDNLAQGIQGASLVDWRGAEQGPDCIHLTESGQREAANRTAIVLSNLVYKQIR